MSLQTGLTSAFARIVQKLNELNTAISAMGGGNKEYAEFYNSTGGDSSISNVPVQLNISQTRINTNDSVISLSSDEVTINKIGNFRFSFDCYLNQVSTSRSEFAFYIEKDSGGGYSEVVATRSANYQRGYDSGQSSSINCILPVLSGDKFRVMVVRTDGGATTCYQDDNGTRLLIEEK
jgi:hypothetical protein